MMHGALLLCGPIRVEPAATRSNVIGAACAKLATDTSAAAATPTLIFDIRIVSSRFMVGLSAFVRCEPAEQVEGQPRLAPKWTSGSEQAPLRWRHDRTARDESWCATACGATDRAFHSASARQ